MNNREGLPIEQESPHDQLYDKALDKLSGLFPDAEEDMRAGRKGRIVDSFLTDVLEEAGVKGGSYFHRMSTEQQKEALSNIDTEAMFEGVSPEIIEFYRKRIDTSDEEATEE